MKTLKELNEKCTLIAEFKHPAFVTTIGGIAIQFDRRPVKAAIYYDNKETYYVYMYITDTHIIEYDNIDKALNRFTRFINNTTNPNE